MSPLRAEYEAEHGRVTDSAYIAFLETLTEQLRRDAELLMDAAIAAGEEGLL